MENLANQNAQPAYTTGEQVKIVSQNVTGTTATYSVTNAGGATISVGLEPADGRWFMHVFT